MYEVLNQGLINPAAAQGADGGWHTTSDTLHGYARKVAEVRGNKGRGMGGHGGGTFCAIRSMAMRAR